MEQPPCSTPPPPSTCDRPCRPCCPLHGLDCRRAASLQVAHRSVSPRCARWLPRRPAAPISLTLPRRRPPSAAATATAAADSLAASAIGSQPIAASPSARSALSPRPVQRPPRRVAVAIYACVLEKLGERCFPSYPSPPSLFLVPFSSRSPTSFLSLALPLARAAILPHSPSNSSFHSPTPFTPSRTFPHSRSFSPSLSATSPLSLFAPFRSL